MPGVFAIFGHGNVTCLGPALHAAGDDLPTWRGQNEQGMALAAVAYAKAMRRRQFMVATSSIGPGALNMVTAAGVAMANRLPVLLLAGRHVPEPPARSGAAAGRALRRPVDDGQRRLPAGRALLGPHHPPEQVIQSLPQAIATLLDPADCGPAFIALPQDVQARGVRLPGPAVRARRSTRSPGRGPTAARWPRPSPRCAAASAPLIDRRRRRPLLAGRSRAGGVRRAPRDPGRRDRRRQVVR